MTNHRDRPLQPRSDSTQIDAFVDRVRRTPVATGHRHGRLLFALDATASRQPTWDQATAIQSQMFQQAGLIGSLEIQLAYYRGYGEFYASPWISDSRELLTTMTSVQCRGGLTQLQRLLRHAVEETGRRKVQAMVFVGDCMEENVDQVCHQAGELGLAGTPVFLFQEGRDPGAENTFREIARLTRGAWCPFDSHSAEQLKQLLTAVAVYASGGRRALDSLAQRSGSVLRQLTRQLPGS